MREDGLREEGKRIDWIARRCRARCVPRGGLALTWVGRASGFRRLRGARILFGRRLLPSAPERRPRIEEPEPASVEWVFLEL